MRGHHRIRFNVRSARGATVLQMGRHPRFEDYRYLGDKRSFVAYDCDDDEQFACVEEIPLEQIASFGPDEPSEYRNRGFRAYGRRRLEI